MFDVGKLKELAVSESGLVFDPASGYIYTSNPVGLLIIIGLRQGKEDDEIRKMILEEYDADEETVERDMFDFFGQLLSYGVIKDV
jgi:hypothetical protein